ncbi:MAG: ThiF family adenylyltransferase [Candidatus Omnitrophica bacterium]|nr:ThiF family adenylyltransferase [Candidatus Omnitrophota bacterium]
MGNDSFYKQMVDRNIGVLSNEEQERLRNSCVAVGGCGGMGGLSIVQLVRLGVGRIKIADFDTFQVHNLSRQCRSTSKNVGRNKTEVISEYCKEINPELKMDIFLDGVKPKNVEKFVDGADAVIDGMDYTYIEDTVALYRLARQKGLCVVNPNAIGFGVSVLVFGPKTVSIEEYFGLSADAKRAEIEKLAPYIPTYADKEIMRKAAMKEINIPNIIMPQNLGTAVAVSEAVMILLGRVEPPAGPNPRIFILDLQDRKFVVTG